MPWNCTCSTRGRTHACALQRRLVEDQRRVLRMADILALAAELHPSRCDIQLTHDGQARAGLVTAQPGDPPMGLLDIP